MARVVVVEQVYYQDDGCQPSSVDLGHVVPVGREQPFVRRTEAQLEWAPVERGWVEECSLMLIVNKSKTSVEVRFGAGDPVAVVPGANLRAHPTVLGGVQLRGSGEVWVYLYP